MFVMFRCSFASEEWRPKMLPSGAVCHRRSGAGWPRRRSRAVVREAFVHGVSTRSVNERDLQEPSQPALRRDRREGEGLPGPADRGRLAVSWIDATYVKVRQNGRIVSVAVIDAVGVNSDGRREMLGMDIGPSEAETFWTAFLRKLARRGLRGVKLVISDDTRASRPRSSRC
jgi:putative transposase